MPLPGVFFSHQCQVYVNDICKLLVCACYGCVYVTVSCMLRDLTRFAKPKAQMASGQGSHWFIKSVVYCALYD